MNSHANASAEHLKPEELKAVLGKANAIFKLLKEKYRGLSGYLVFSSSWGQCALTADAIKILKDFKGMVVDSREKERAFELIRTLTELESGKKSGEAKASAEQATEKAKLELTAVADRLAFREETCVEIRFEKVDLEMIFAMQKDELVSRRHTPQTKASIRIVLGTLGELR